jgi:hypothetical protein
MRVSIACVLLALAAPAPGGAERSSPPLVKELVAALAARQLDAIAAPDPDEPGRFVAALVFPGVQMLLVSSRHDSAAALTAQIGKRQFRDVYVALQNGTPAGRLFIHDMGCDGLGSGVEDIDIVYEGAGQRTVFDGNWEGQSLTETAYEEKLERADEQYSHAVTVLLGAIRRLSA